MSSIGKQSIIRAELSFRHLEAHLGHLEDIVSLAVAQYIEDRLKEGAARSTVNRELAALKRAYNLAIRQGILTTRPYIPQLRENNVRKGFLTAEKLQCLLECLPEYLRPLVRVAYITGWRKGELLSRRWEHVEGGWLRINPGETKNGEGRQFPLTAELRVLLEAQRKASTQLLVGVPPSRTACAEFQGFLASSMHQGRSPRAVVSRPTKDCSAEHGTGRSATTYGEAVHRTQDRLRVPALRHRG